MFAYYKGSMREPDFLKKLVISPHTPLHMLTREEEKDGKITNFYHEKQKIGNLESRISQASIFDTNGVFKIHRFPIKTGAKKGVMNNIAYSRSMYLETVIEETSNLLSFFKDNKIDSIINDGYQNLFVQDWTTDEIFYKSDNYSLLWYRENEILLTDHSSTMVKDEISQIFGFPHMILHQDDIVNIKEFSISFIKMKKICKICKDSSTGFMADVGDLCERCKKIFEGVGNPL